MTRDPFLQGTRSLDRLHLRRQMERSRVALGLPSYLESASQCAEEALLVGWPQNPNHHLIRTINGGTAMPALKPCTMETCSRLSLAN
jgi:hypothetical protein